MTYQFYRQNLKANVPVPAGRSTFWSPGSWSFRRRSADQFDDVNSALLPPAATARST